MVFFDIHTHRVPLHSGRAVVSFPAGEETCLSAATYASVGIHPWHLSESEVERRLAALKTLATHENVVAIGEVGLDKLAEAPLALQMCVFREEIALAEHLCLPLVIHCVRAFNELLQLKKELHPGQPWVIHGFRGKAELADMCIRHGCYLSFGAKFQEAALRAVPLDRLFVETDEAQEPVAEIYRRIAEVRGISVEHLADAVNKNARKVFFRH